MKMKHPGGLKLAALLSTGLLATAAIAGAQASYYYTDGAAVAPPAGAILGGTLAGAGFDSYQLTNISPVTHVDNGSIGPADDGFGTLYYANYMVSGLPATLGDGSTLSSVTFYLYAEGVTPTGQSFQIYENVYDNPGGLGAGAGFINPIANQYYSFTVSAAVLAGGFSLATLNENDGVNFSTETNGTATRTPMIVANYAIPEPSTALLGAVAALGLLRRRRQA